VEKGQAGIAKLQQVKINAKKDKKRRKDTTYACRLYTPGPMRYDASDALRRTQAYPRLNI